MRGGGVKMTECPRKMKGGKEYFFRVVSRRSKLKLMFKFSHLKQELHLLNFYGSLDGEKILWTHAFMLGIKDREYFKRLYRVIYK